MPRAKLSAGVHNVRIKTGKGNKTRMQKVRVNAKGQWKFLKNTSKAGTSKKKATKRGTKRVVQKVRKTAKGKFFKNMGLVGFAEDLAWGYGGLVVLGANNPSSLPTARAIQGIQAYALDRRGKSRLMFAITDLIDLWLAGGYTPSIGGLAQVTNMLKIRPL